MKNEIILKDISFTYENERKKTLKDCNLDICANEVIFITGKSGSGKSSLLNILNGVIPEVMEGNLTGDVIFNDIKNPDITTRNKNMANVFQNPRSQFFTNDSTAELVFEMENLGFSKEKMQKKLEEIVEKYDIKYLLNRDIQTLSSGERQFLALISAIIINPDYVLFDEPSSNLDYGNAMRLKREIVKLKNEGKTVIVSDHRCFYLDGIIDRVFLIDNQKVYEFKNQKSFEKSDYAFRKFDIFNDIYPNRAVTKTEESLFEVKKLQFKHILKDVSFKLNKGEITFLTGVNGAGKTTLAKIMADNDKYEQNGIICDTRTLYIMQDADYQLFGSSVFNELNLNCDDEKRIEEALKKVDLLDFKDKHPHELSGGQKQRLQIAISFVTDFKIIVFDEPTSGLDSHNMNNVIKHINELRQNASILIISHDYEFIRKVADRILYLKDGIIQDDFYMEDISKLNNIFKEMEEFYEQKI